MSDRFRVTFTVEYDVRGDLPPAGDEEFDMFLVASMLNESPGGVHIHWADDEPVELEPVGWGVDAGVYGDLSTGLTL